ncbi:CoA-binding protein [Sporolituus thermophilus]|uniref:CoA-binding domain-containing protein n=1 Tax=Sporolituus thermophilus DSM 23256 TaxID=1123285 RepID=A0A1G7I478_9FIRM|nr:CoA-binding protein [Sporolituus thermophilus]SDF07495.1 hypothetical protein SAMN05660235_00333 [Sporolituus thermophilus DSM 23256]
MKLIDDFLKLKTWAVVGATNNREKFGFKIFHFLRESGYKVYAVNPGVTEIEGEKCYPTLGDLPDKPDVVDIVVPPRVGEKILHDCAKLNIKNVWLQPGADTEQVIRTAESLGLNVVHHACVMVEIRNRKA